MEKEKSERERERKADRFWGFSAKWYFPFVPIVSHYGFGECVPMPM